MASGSDISLVTLSAVDLALSAVSADVIDDVSQFAFGVVDGMRMAHTAYTAPDLVPSEVLGSLDADLEPTLMERSRVLGMLAGTLAGLRLQGGDNSSNGEIK